MRTVKTDTIEVWKAKIIEQEHINKLLEDIKSEINEKLQEPEYQHEGEDWQSGLIMAETIIDKHTNQKEESNFEHKCRVSMTESCFLDQGITQC